LGAVFCCAACTTQRTPCVQSAWLSLCLPSLPSAYREHSCTDVQSAIPSPPMCTACSAVAMHSLHYQVPSPRSAPLCTACVAVRCTACIPQPPFTQVPAVCTACTAVHCCSLNDPVPSFPSPTVCTACTAVHVYSLSNPVYSFEAWPLPCPAEPFECVQHMSQWLTYVHCVQHSSPPSVPWLSCTACTASESPA
jgi:hypothetical protein